MSQHNHYAPPTAEVADSAEILQPPKYGLKLSGSLFWRILVLQFVLVMPMTFLLASSELNENLSFLKLKPSLIYASLVAVVAASLLVFRPGVLFLVWGVRLNLPIHSWRRFSWLFCVIYATLALANAAIAVAGTTEAWVQFKAYAPLLGLLVTCLAAPRLASRPNPSVKGTSRKRAAPYVER
jgi:intracellular septation protein A